MLKLSHAQAEIGRIVIAMKRTAQEHADRIVTVRMTCEVIATAINTLADGLAQSLYCAYDDEGNQLDFIAGPQALTTPKFPAMKPMQIVTDTAGYALRINHLGEDVAIDEATLRSVAIEPNSGGIATLTTVLEIPDRGDIMATLALMVGESITVDMTPPEVADTDDLEDEAARNAA